MRPLPSKMHQISYEKYLKDQQFKPLTQYIEDKKIMHNVMTDEVRLVIRAIIIELYFLHKMGKCPRRFDESNVFIREDGVAQLRDCCLDDKSDFKVFENYLDAKKIIVKTVFQQQKYIPEDVRHLLKLIDTSDKVIGMELEYLICTHASLVPLRNRGSFFLWMYEHISFVLPESIMHKDILKDLPYKSNWYDKLIRNDLLKKLFRLEKYSEGIYAFLVSYRNANDHSMEGKIYNPDDIQQALWVTFPILLPRMQEELWKNEQLKALQLDSLFGSNIDKEFGVIMDPSAVLEGKESNNISFQVGLMSISVNQNTKNSIDADSLPMKKGVLFPFCNKHHVSFMEYIRNKEFKPLTEYIKHTLLKFDDETGEREYCLMTEEAKFVIGALFKELYFLHKRGKCPQNFNESNVFIREDGIVQLRECNLDDKSDTKVFENYQDAQNIIVRIVFQQQKQYISEDVRHLLNLMNTPDKVISKELEYLICTHASLIPLRNRRPFFLRMYEHISFVLPQQPRDEQTKKEYTHCASPEKLDWGDRLQGNDILEKLLSLRTDGCKEEEINYFLRSYRHAVYHCLEGNMHTPEETQLILWATYPMLLPTMQQELWNKNQLRALQLGGLFGSAIQKLDLTMGPPAVRSRSQ